MPRVRNDYRTRLALEQAEIRRMIRNERLSALVVVVAFPLIVGLIIHLCW